MAVQERSAGGITLLVLNQAELARMFTRPGMVGRWMNTVGRQVEELAVANVIEGAKGYGKGVLESSMGHSVTPAGPRGMNLHVRNSDPHALFIHEGTMPHMIYPHRPLVRNTTGSNKVWDRPTGGLVFFWRRKAAWVRMDHVSHPGIRANPFLADAMRDVLRLRGVKKL